MNPPTTLTNHNPPATIGCGLNPNPIRREESDTPHFRTDAASAAVLSAQRVDTRALLADAQTRGWIDEADRHRRLLDRLDTLIANTA